MWKLLVVILVKYCILPLSGKECNYGLRAIKSSSRLTVNTIHIYDSKLIYYKNTFHN